MIIFFVATRLVDVFGCLLFDLMLIVQCCSLSSAALGAAFKEMDAVAATMHSGSHPEVARWLEEYEKMILFFFRSFAFLHLGGAPLLHLFFLL